MQQHDIAHSPFGRLAQVGVMWHDSRVVFLLQNAVMGREAQLHVVLAGTMAEVTQAVAQTCAPQGTRGVLPPTLASLEMQAKLQIMYAHPTIALLLLCDLT